MSQPKEYDALVPPRWKAPHVGHAFVEGEENASVAARRRSHHWIWLTGEPLRLDRVDVVAEGREVVNQFDGQVLVELDAHVGQAV